MVAAAASDEHNFLLFEVGARRYALSLNKIECVVPATHIGVVDVHAPNLAGLANLCGEILPVFNVRAKLGATPRELSVLDDLVVLNERGRRVALWTGPGSEVAGSVVDDTATHEHSAFIHRGYSIPVLDTHELLANSETPLS